MFRPEIRGGVEGTNQQSAAGEPEGRRQM